MMVNMSYGLSSPTVAFFGDNLMLEGNAIAEAVMLFIYYIIFSLNSCHRIVNVISDHQPCRVIDRS